MKSVLFAVKSSDIDNATLEAFETQMMQNLRNSSRDFEDAVGNHCDYREGLLSACNQYRPDVLIINEELSGNGEITDVIKSIKSQYPSLLVIVLLTKQRVIGDARLANLTTMGVYNWLSPPWKIAPIAKMITNPKTMKDVDAYMPKMVQGQDGMVFETKVVDSSAIQNEKLDDLDDVGVNINKQSGPNYVVAGDVRDINDTPVDNGPHSYQKVINGGFNFKGGVKPHYQEPPKPQTPKPQPVREQPQPIKEQPKPVEVQEKPKEEVKKPQPVKEDLTPKEPSVTEKTETAPKEKPESAIEERNRRLEEAIKRMSNKPSTEELEAEMQEALTETPEPEIEEKPVQPVKKPEVKKPAPKSSGIDQNKADILDSLSTDLTKKQPESKPVEKPVAAPVKPEPKQQPQKAEPEKEKKLIDVTKIKLPKAKKILFLHAAPITSSLAVQIAYFLKRRGSSVTFVDLNKNSYLKPFYKEENSLVGIPTIHSDFKSYKNTDDEYVIADAVAGNGIEKIIPLFDHVTVIIPSDLNVLRTFTERYRSLLGSFGIAVDKAFAGSFGPKQFKEVCNGPKYCELLRVNPQEKDSSIFSYKDLLDAEANGDSLADNDEYIATLKFLLEGIR